MDDFTKEIRRLARRVAAVYRRHTEPRAILLVGTGATGGADRFSDLEMLLYYDDVPREDTLAAARRELQGKNLKGTLSDEGYSERYDVGGIHCQLGHAIIGPWEREIARVVDDLELDAALVKELSGLFEGLPLHGDELVGQWRERAAYTERLQRAMIEKHWNFFPWWYYQEKLGLRDATIWRHDVLVQSAYNIAGVLAALNRVYFSTLSSSAFTGSYSSFRSRHRTSTSDWKRCFRRTPRNPRRSWSGSSPTPRRSLPSISETSTSRSRGGTSPGLPAVANRLGHRQTVSVGPPAWCTTDVR
jgi:hypothetical protein